MFLKSNYMLLLFGISFGFQMCQELHFLHITEKRQLVEGLIRLKTDPMQLLQSSFANY